MIDVCFGLRPRLANFLTPSLRDLPFPGSAVPIASSAGPIAERLAAKLIAGAEPAGRTHYLAYSTPCSPAAAEKLWFG